MYQSISEKLNQQHDKQLTLCFFDIDGTIFTAGWRLFLAPFWNLQTRKLLKDHSIPYVLISGRQELNELMPHEMTLHGFDTFDAMILGAGTVIHYKNSHGKLTLDEEWRSSLMKTGWEHEDIKSRIQKIRKDYTLPVRFAAGNKFLIRLSVDKIALDNLHHIVTTLEKNLPSFIRIDLSEALLHKNTEKVFTGNLLIMPSIAGKDNATKYVISSLKVDKKKTDIFLFGDAMVDIPMLSLKSWNKDITLHPYLVHPTAQAKIKAKEDSDITILESEGPQSILGILRSFLANKSSDKQYFSPAQNNPLRKASRLVEPLLNKLVDPSLNPNGISLLGIKKVKQSLEFAESKNIFKKLYAVWLYLSGNILDLFDGIRSRQKNYEQKIPGQLMDGYSDRKREFIVVYNRAQTREGNKTYEAALSCFLPSIARAQAEFIGATVPERDKAGGSALDRNKLLFLSFFFHTFGLDNISYQLDREIYRRNIATFENRLSLLTHKLKDVSIDLQLKTINPEVLSSFEKEALERFFLYTNLLQQANKISKVELKEVAPYLKVDISKIRKRFQLKDYKLSI